MKKSLLLHHDFYRMFELLSYEEAGKLIMAAFDYDINGAVTEFEDRLMTSCYLRLIDAIDRNRSHYEAVCLKKAEAAQKRWHKEETERDYN